jgi:hypothetical protein
VGGGREDETNSRCPLVIMSESLPAAQQARSKRTRLINQYSRLLCSLDGLIHRYVYYNAAADVVS